MSYWRPSAEVAAAHGAHLAPSAHRRPTEVTATHVSHWRPSAEVAGTHVPHRRSTKVAATHEPITTHMSHWQTAKVAATHVSHGRSAHPPSTHWSRPAAKAAHRAAVKAARWAAVKAARWAAAKSAHRAAAKAALRWWPGRVALVALVARGEVRVHAARRTAPVARACGVLLLGVALVTGRSVVKGV